MGLIKRLAKRVENGYDGNYWTADLDRTRWFVAAIAAELEVAGSVNAPQWLLAELEEDFVVLLDDELGVDPLDEGRC